MIKYLKSNLQTLIIDIVEVKYVLYTFFKRFIFWQLKRAKCAKHVFQIFLF